MAMGGMVPFGGMPPMVPPVNSDDPNQNGMNYYMQNAAAGAGGPFLLPPAQT